jgi:phosphate:Na+ symporter
MEFLIILIQTVGGLGVFLYGMAKMSDGLKMAAGGKIRSILAGLTKNRVLALLVGAAITALVQSSSASTVMTVGFVNAGLLTLKQAVSVVIGANIGTTLTAWLVSIIGKFKISAYALPAIGAGFFMRMYGRKGKWFEWGNILLGFGMIFLGLDVMKEAFGPIKKSQAVIDLFARFSQNPLLGVLVGAAFTMLLQSSSATIAIVQLLAFNGVLDLYSAIPLILGDNIGTTITAAIASIGTNVNAKRVARAHLLFNIVGVSLIFPFVWLGVYGRFIEAVFPGEISAANIMAHIALSHTLFNVVNALFFTLFLDALIKVATALVKSEKADEVLVPRVLEERLLDDPSIAMEQVVREIVNMALTAKKAVASAETAFLQCDEKAAKQAMEYEKLINEYQSSITRYLIRISEKHLSARESNAYPVLIHCVNDLEKVGDYAKNMAGDALEVCVSRCPLSAGALAEIAAMFRTLHGLMDLVIASLRDRDMAGAKKALALEDEIDWMKLAFREGYLRRLRENAGSPEGEVVLMDQAKNIEKAADHLVNIAQSVIQDLQWDSRTVEAFAW